MARQHVMHTFNPIHDYEFSWTVDNFIRTTDIVWGPRIYPLPGRYNSNIFRLQIKSFEYQTDGRNDFYLDVNLWKEADDTEQFNVGGYIHLKTIEGKNLTSYSITIREVLKDTNILYSYPACDRKRKWSLPQGKLIVEGTLTFSGFNQTSEISSPSTAMTSAGPSELLNDIKNMFKRGLAHDVIFTLDDETFRCHKAILASRSPVFEKMFNSNMRESITNNVVIQDIDAEVFNCFLLFLYTGVVENKEWDNVVLLYSLSDKYQVDSLRKECSRILCNSMTVSSVCSVIQLCCVTCTTIRN